MRIVDLRVADFPLKSEMSNAVIDFSQMTVSVVALITDVVRDGEPVVGYAYNTNGRYGAGGLMRERFIPRILAADPDSLMDRTRDNIDPMRVWDCMMTNEKPGGHGERSVAVGVIDVALWDAVAKIEEKPISRLLAERFGRGEAAEKVSVYAAGGYYDADKGIEGVRREVESYRERGYEMVKIKVGGAPLDEDLRRIDAALSVVGEGRLLGVDANARFDLDGALAYGRALAPFGLAWFEEPGDPLDFELNARFAGAYEPAIATGENLFSLADARNLLRYAGLRPDRDYLQFDSTLAYGFTEYLRILEVVRDHGWSHRRVIPHGGHLMSLGLAAGLGLGGCEAYPDVFKPFSGFADDIPVENGFVRLPDAPGIGFETQNEVFALLSGLARA
jgi:L-alanine-DL-glutamate epimerase-like enolase superfamily enzyme